MVNWVVFPALFLVVPVHFEPRLAEKTLQLFVIHSVKKNTTDKQSEKRGFPLTLTDTVTPPFAAVLTYLRSES